MVIGHDFYRLHTVLCCRSFSTACDHRVFNTIIPAVRSYVTSVVIDTHPTKGRCFPSPGGKSSINTRHLVLVLHLGPGFHIKAAMIAVHVGVLLQNIRHNDMNDYA